VAPTFSENVWNWLWKALNLEMLEENESNKYQLNTENKYSLVVHDISKHKMKIADNIGW
jgi:hypothetical protein